MNASSPGEPREPGPPEHLASPSGAEYHASLEKRVSLLEMRFDTILPTLATKSDIAELRSELRTEMSKLSEKLHEDMYKMSEKLYETMHRLHRQLLMWIVSTMIAMFLGMVGLFATISSNMNQTTERMMQAQVSSIEAAHAAAHRPAPGP